MYQKPLKCCLSAMVSLLTVPGSSRMLRQSLTIGLDSKELIISDRQQLSGVGGTSSEDQTAHIAGLQCRVILIIREDAPLISLTVTGHFIYIIKNIVKV